MITRSVLRLPLALLVFVLMMPVASASAVPSPRQLTFEERVAAQEAIERVYDSYREGRSLPFEAAVPQQAIEAKVRKYLQQSLALERFWNTPITAAALRAELERTVRDTRFPGRLQQIFDALGNDAFLIQETFIRPVLVDRLSRRFFASDERIHAPARAEAEDALRWLQRGRVDREKDPRWAVIDVVLAGDMPSRESLGGIPRVELAPDEFARWRARLPETVGELGSVREQRSAFTIEMLLVDGPKRFRVGSYTVPKRSWDSWWADVRDGLDARVVSVASGVEGLPAPGNQEGTCVGDLWDNGVLDDLPEPRFDHTAIWTGSRMIIWGGVGTSPHLNSGALYDPLTDTWTPMTMVDAPESRRSHTAVWTGTEMIVWGGDRISNVLNTGGRYNPATDTWLPVETLNAPVARHEHTAVWTGTEMIVWGGDAGSNAFSTGGRYNPSTNSWTPTVIAGSPLGRSGHVAVWTGSLMIVWGGSDSAAVNTGGRYSPFTDSWALTTQTGAPQQRTGHSAVWTGTEMIVWGGVDFAELLNTGSRYNPVTDTWTGTSTLNGPSKRRDHTATWTGDKMVIWGGTSGSNLDTGAVYDAATDTWTTTSPLNAPTPRGLHAAVWTGDVVVVWGGSQEGELNTTGGRYHLASDSWTPTATANGQVGRKDHTAVWTGTEMLVFGGFSTPGPTYLNSGGRYDPLVDNWTDMSLAGAPEGRELHRAAWTGSLMLIWGGFNGNAYLNSGGRYNPLVDTWTPMTTTNAPTARQGPSAVWTGTELVVWGGFENNVYLRDGRRYDPGSDTWTAVTMTGAPGERYLHSAVWTGGEMLIWGGTSELGILNSGGRYDPATDTWASMTSAGAPSPRNRHEAVWTGDKMVVWGGFDAIEYLSSGGRYDPSTDTWLPVTTLGAPEGRVNHTAVWTGEFMVVWGGFDGTQFPYLGTGAQYDPASDAWTAISQDAAPSPRNDHTAVWIGDRMIVWGGSDGSVLNTGGRYILTAIPGEVAGLGFQDATTLSWSQLAGSGVLHDVLRGRVGQLPVGGGVSETCIASGIAGTSTVDASDPGLGNVFWYLSRGVNACAPGTWGSDSSGVERLSSACP